MAIYIVTGHLGSGKSLLAVQRAFDYLRAGKRVASNITLNLDAGLPPMSKATAIKLPYIPTGEHLEALGSGYEGDYDEDKFGLLILDEAGSWLNSRDWSNKDRRGLFTWVTHARKHGWDVMLIVQDMESMDAQIRRSVCELYVSCSRLDRVKLPYLPVRLPRVHVATARYKGPSGSKVDRWYTRGTDMFKAYDTRESVRDEFMFDPNDANRTIDMRACSSMLSAWHLHGRYLPVRPTRRQRLLFALGLAFICTVAFPLAALAGRSPVRAVREIITLQKTRFHARLQPRRRMSAPPASASQAPIAQPVRADAQPDIQYESAA